MADDCLELPNADDSDRFSHLRLQRATSIARRALVLARVLLQTAEMGEAKKEDVARWLTVQELDLNGLEEEGSSVPTGGKLVNAPSNLLTEADEATIAQYPHRTFAVSLVTVGESVCRGELVEVLCRIPDGATLVRAPKTNKTERVAHASLVVVQEGPSGMPWAMAEVQAVADYQGAGPELSFCTNDVIMVIKANSNGWWKGLVGQDSAAGLFLASMVKVHKIYSSAMDNFVRKLMRACVEEPDQGSAKLKLAMGGALHDRGAEEVSAFHMLVWNQVCPESYPPVFVSSCKCLFPLTDEERTVVRPVRFTAQDGVDGVDSIDIEVLTPRLGPNLLDRCEFSFEPSSFSLAGGDEVDVNVSVTMGSPQGLESSIAVLIPVVFTCRANPGMRVRYFLYCEVSTPRLIKKDRMSLLMDDSEHHSSSEMWGETMSSADLASAGLTDLLSDLLVMPESQRPTPPVRRPTPLESPSPPVSGNSKNAALSSNNSSLASIGGLGPRPGIQRTARTDSLSRSSESTAVSPRIVARISNTRHRASSSGNQEDSTSSPGSSGASSVNQTSPRGVLANIRARVARGRTQSAGDEQDASAPVFLKDRKSPRSPRMAHTDESSSSSPTALPFSKQKSRDRVSPRVQTEDVSSNLTNRPNPTVPQMRRTADKVSNQDINSTRRHSPVSPLVGSSFGPISVKGAERISPLPNREIFVPSDYEDSDSTQVIDSHGSSPK